MHLEDGRFLIPAERYDKLLKVFHELFLPQSEQFIIHFYLVLGSQSR